MDASLPPSPQVSSPSTSWSDARSHFARSLYESPAAAGSSTSLWTASSASDAGDDDMSAELRCLELLAELDQGREAAAKDLGIHLGQCQGRNAWSREKRLSSFQHVRDESLPDVVQPLDVGKARAARNAKFGSQGEMLSLQQSPSAGSKSADDDARRISFTATNLADLDIDAILAAYTCEPLPAPALSSEVTFSGGSIPRSAPSHNLRDQVRSDNPCRLERTSTVRSTRSTAMRKAFSDDKHPHRRTAPFPTITRQRSNASIASRKLPFDDAAPLPPLPPSTTMLTSVPMSNRTFSSFSRQSTASNVSCSSAPSPSLRSAPSPRMSYASSTMSRQTSASSASVGNSFRWSVATSSTAPTFASEGSDCGASRRGSIAPSVIGSVKGSPGGVNRRHPSAPFAGSPIERDEDGPFWSRRGSTVAEESLDGSQRPSRASVREDEGLMSWEDFAEELASLPVPTRPTPRRMNSQSSTTSSQASRSRAGSTASFSTRPPLASHASSSSSTSSSSRLVFSSPESTRSSSTLRSIPGSKPAPFSPSTSPTTLKSGAKKGFLHGLKSMKSSRDLASSFA
ncbi:hypothetical protein JCM10212_002238 [Sporobolomyces blumeae]